LNAPSAIDLFRGPVPVTSSYSFDLAVELSGTDRVLFIPNSRLAGGLVATHRVGLQRTGDAFDAVHTAPISGYKYDSVFVVRPGETVIVESANPAACAVPFYGTVIYAKFVVDSIKTAPGRVYLRTTVDPNCGFRSLVAGSTPKE